MSRVIFDISASLDGFATAANLSAREPMGIGGERLHEWAFSGKDDRNGELLAGAVSTVGAVIAGRRTYDHAVPWWGADGPSGPARIPVIVVSHGTPDDVPEGGVYTFAGGIEEALSRARSAAGGRDVAVMGGADVGNQFIRAGLVDEISLHLVPVLLGAGTPLFDRVVTEHTTLEVVDMVSTAEATHLRYRVLGKGAQPDD